MMYSGIDYMSRESRNDYAHYIRSMGGRRFHSMNAFIIERDNDIYFYSYRTLIAIVHKSGYVEIEHNFYRYSASTINQLNRFLREYTSCDYLSVKEAYNDMSGYVHGLWVTPEYSGECYNVSASDNDVTYNVVSFF